MLRKSVSKDSFADNEPFEHGYFAAAKFLVLAPVALAGLSQLIIGFALVFALSTHFANAYVNPGNPAGFVNDFAHVLQPSTVQSLDAQLQSLQDATGDQVAVVTISSLGGDTIENYAVKLFQEWGIGNKAHDNGILILVSSGDHEARIEVGYGLEGTVTDLQSGNIIRNVMIPAFKNNDYDGGISGGVKAVSDIITGSADAAQYSEPVSNTSSSSDFNPAPFIFFGILLLNALARILGKTKSWWLGGVIGAVIGIIITFFVGLLPIGLTVIIVLTLLGLLFDYLVSKHPPTSGPGGRGGIWPIFLGGNRNSSGTGSSFGGFGGGMSGGGGASGKW